MHSWLNYRMAVIQNHIAGGTTRHRVVGRTAGDFAALLATIKDEPETWFVYSIHMNMPAAHNAASRLRRRDIAAALVPFRDNLEFKAYRHVAHGPAVLVRWVPHE